MASFHSTSAAVSISTNTITSGIIPISINFPANFTGVLSFDTGLPDGFGANDLDADGEGRLRRVSWRRQSQKQKAERRQIVYH